VFYHESWRKEINDAHLYEYVDKYPILILSLLSSLDSFFPRGNSFPRGGSKASG
jgi:hypothetical protein